MVPYVNSMTHLYFLAMYELTDTHSSKVSRVTIREVTMILLYHLYYYLIYILWKNGAGFWTSQLSSLHNHPIERQGCET